MDEVRVYGRALAADEIFDWDADGERDVCDLNDGLILLSLPEPNTVDYQKEFGFRTFNIYRGDIMALAATRIYTQSTSLVPDAADFCAEMAGTITDSFLPAENQIVYYLVTGVDSAGVEGSLGTDSAGNVRPNDNPCPRSVVSC